MEGHQHDSESDMKNKQRKKHLKKRTYNRMLTDAITHELKRLSGISDYSVTLGYEDKYLPISDMNEVCINQALMYQNQIPHSIDLDVLRFKKNVDNNSYMYSNGKEEITPYNSFRENNSSRIELLNYKQGEWYNNCYGSNVSKLFTFAKSLYETSQQLQHTTQNTTSPNVATSDFYVVHVELENLRKLLNPVPKYDIIPLKQKNQMQFGRNITKVNDVDRPIEFKVSIERHSMRFDMNLSKINIFSLDFLQALYTFFSMFPLSNNCGTDNKVPCLIIRSWHFRNIVQGYLLGLLLRNINVNSLNMMRKLYFVIITSSAGNLTIELTIKLKSGIFMVYDKCIYQKVVNWNRRHKVYITKSVSMTVLENLLQSNTRNRENRLRVISYSKVQQSNLLLRRCYDECLSRTKSKASRTHTNHGSDTESLESIGSDNSTVLLHKSHSSIFIFSPDDGEVPEANRVALSKTHACNTIVNNVLDNNHNMYNVNFLHSKQWLMKLLPTRACYGLNEQIRLQNISQFIKYSSIKETILYQTSTHIKHFEAIRDLFWKEVTSQPIYILLLKSLGLTISNIFFSTVLKYN